MTSALFTQLLVNGLATGMVYVLIASGLILVLGVARIFNFAHGESLCDLCAVSGLAG
jgi:branched-chain amino acid transport system permease protein